MKKKTLLIAGTALLMMLIGGCGKREEINLNDYVVVEYEGYDSMGTAVATFDYKGLRKDFKEVLKLTKAGEKEQENLKDEAKDRDYGTSTPELLAACLDGSLDNTDGLSNGDTITFEWAIDEEQIEKLFNCDLVYSSIEFEVEDLEEITRVDLFKDIKVNITGTSPFVDVKLEGSCDYREVSFRVIPESSYGLMNGDAVKVVAEIEGESDIEKYFFENYEVLPEALEMEYTVEGLSSYVTSASDLSDEVLEKMKKEVEDDISSYVAPWESGDNRRLLGCEYIGMYVRTLKEGKYGDECLITLVYRCDSALYYENCHSDGYTEDIVSFYIPVTFKNATVLPDGTVSVSISDHKFCQEYFYVLEANSWAGLNKFEYKGFEDLDSLFNKYITENLDKYTYEDTVEDTPVPEYPDAFDFVETED